MKKYIIILALFTAVLFSSCGVKRGMGLVNNRLLMRDWYGDVCIEESLGFSVNNNFRFSDYSYDYPGNEYNDREDRGNYYNYIALGFAAYLKVFSNNTISLSAGLSYTDLISVLYYDSGQYQYQNLNTFYSHDTDFSLGYANNHSITIIFPDLEINTPFMDGLKFVLKADLINIYINLHGGYLNYQTHEKNDTLNGNYSFEQAENMLLPGTIHGIHISSTYLNLENITLGLIYYFK
jgi:hypothetical protein